MRKYEAFFTYTLDMLSDRLSDGQGTESIPLSEADAKALTTDDIKSGISTIFGVSGFGAAAIEKLDKTSSKNTAKEPKDE